MLDVLFLGGFVGSFVGLFGVLLVLFGGCLGMKLDFGVVSWWRLFGLLELDF